MSNNRGLFRHLFHFFASILRFVRNALLNIFIFLFAIIMFSALFGGEETYELKPETALVLNLEGNLVIQKQFISPIKQLESNIGIGPQQFNEVLLSDVLTAIERASKDDRITSIVLDLHKLNRGGLDKLYQINQALAGFQAAGKTVHTMGDYFTQTQYYLASKSNNIFLHPMGGVILDGYGRYKNYYKEALEKFNITAHVFRVGEFKSAVEPYLRSDMSDAAKAANIAWIQSLWDQYKQTVASNRQFEVTNFDESLSVLNQKISQVNGSFAQYALNNGWVDGLITREQFAEHMEDYAKSDDSTRGYQHVSLNQYLAVSQPNEIDQLVPADKVAVIVAKGTILDGRQNEGDIGGDSTAELIRRARLNDNVKALVLHVDSPGGSAFASEIIREQLIALKQAGKPLVVSMSTYAASGGYWISANADEIWAAPSTITGSIGVYGMFLAFDKVANEYGIYNDGVGTTELSGLSQLRALDSAVGDLIQMNIEHSYDSFIKLVSESRQLSYQSVDAVAQGRVWTGSDAKVHGLVDQLGYLSDAIESAATMAELHDYDTLYIEREKTPEEIILQELFGQVSAWLPTHSNDVYSTEHAVIRSFHMITNELKVLLKLNDPNGVYALCEVCQ